MITKYSDEYYMKRALNLARRGGYRVKPNPQVGAVIVKEKRIIARGFHHYFGGPHAEVDAINLATEDVKNGTLYVNLEPCSFHGKTPPCTDLIIRSGIGRVVTGIKDPNPLVSGNGITVLREAGVEVTEDILKEECLEINAHFFRYITRKLPFVTMKAAMTLDGKIATSGGESQWITSLESRRLVHRMRRQSMAVMTGVNTAIADDPLLNARLDRKDVWFPLRVILDSKLRIPLDLRIFKADHISQTLIATTPAADMRKAEIIRESGGEVIIVPGSGEQVDLRQLMVILGEKGIDSILLEGGSELNFSALQAGIVNRVSFFIAPKIIGGVKALPVIGGTGISLLGEAFGLSDWKVKKSGQDLLIEAEVMNIEI
jgi:diaminohydroxyphosphoribosylaminopyrimidine deaminase / 5-amino-6-(5-phosphoribosylamino)uracil reductase